jgi:CRISPR/Cas system-associated exonuclease Cas4 (RecB family)
MPEQNEFYISPSGLNSFFTCQAQHAYGRVWKTKVMSQTLKDGNDAHMMMCGWSHQDIGASAQAAVFAEGLRRLESEHQYTVLERERKQRFQIARGIDLVRIIDAIAVKNGELVLIDYKTGNWPWTKVGDYVPKAMGWQSKAYLVPPPPGLIALEEWATELHYLVVTKKGKPSVFKYKYQKEDKKELVAAARQVKKMGTPLKHRSWICPKYCDFNLMCFDVPGWERHYVRRADVKDKMKTLYGE